MTVFEHAEVIFGDKHSYFEVSVHHVMAVQVLKGIQHLSGIEPRMNLRKPDKPHTTPSFRGRSLATALCSGAACTPTEHC